MTKAQLWAFCLLYAMMRASLINAGFKYEDKLIVECEKKFDYIMKEVCGDGTEQS